MKDIYRKDNEELVQTKSVLLIEETGVFIITLVKLRVVVERKLNDGRS